MGCGFRGGPGATAESQGGWHQPQPDSQMTVLPFTSAEGEAATDSPSNLDLGRIGSGGGRSPKGKEGRKTIASANRWHIPEGNSFTFGKE